MKILASLLVVLSFGLGACVSINVGGGKAERADDVEFNEPPDPFDDEDAGNVDEGWKNPKNGNSISYISECNTGQDPSLQSVRSGVLSTLSEAEVTSEDKRPYNGREALRSEASGKVDGVVTRLDLMIFKKNNCLYIITYVALPDSYDADRKHFENFLEGFKAP